MNSQCTSGEYSTPPPRIVKEIECFISPTFSRKLLLLLHKNREKFRPLENEKLRSARVKSTLDHLEINLGDGRFSNFRMGSEKRDSFTIRSSPSRLDSSLLGYFINDECHFVPVNGEALVMDNIKESVQVFNTDESPVSKEEKPSVIQTTKPSVVSARLKVERNAFNSKPLAIRRKPTDNDPDITYLNQLKLTPWKPVRFRRYKSTNAFEDRSILMCPIEQNNNDFENQCEDFSQTDCEELLLSKIKQDATESRPHSLVPNNKVTLEDFIRSILIKAQVIRFDKLLECLRDRFHDKDLVNFRNVVPILERIAVLVCAWWVIKSDVLYPPNTFSEHESVPSTRLIRARDYVMAVFHRGGHLTRKTVSSVTKIPSLEVTEILENLGSRIIAGNSGHSNHWEFHQPDQNFARRYPDIIYQQNTGWELRIRQLCTQLKIENLISDVVHRRRCCSGQLSPVDENYPDSRSPLPPGSQQAARKRRRLQSLSPVDNLRPSGKRIRTQSMSVNTPTSNAPTVKSSSANISLTTPSALPTAPLFENENVNLNRSLNTPDRAENELIVSESPRKIAVEDTSDDKFSFTVIRPPTDPSAFKREPPSPSKPVIDSDDDTLKEDLPQLQASDAEPASGTGTEPGYQMEKDVVLINFVRGLLKSQGVVALSDLSKSCQPFLSSLSESALCTGTPPPPGSEAERELLKMHLYNVALVAGAHRLKVVWPDIPSSLPEQPLFVVSVEPEMGSSDLHRLRDIILTGFETSSYITFGEVKRQSVREGLDKVSDNTIRTTIKRYCIYRHAKYFLRHSVSE